MEKQPLEVFYKKDFFKALQNSPKNTRAKVSFSIKLQVPGSNFIKKENSTQVFFCEYCKSSLKMFFYRVHPGDCFWMCLLFLYFRFVLLLHSSVKFGVSVVFGCRELLACMFFYEFLTWHGCGIWNILSSPFSLPSFHHYDLLKTGLRRGRGNTTLPRKKQGSLRDWVRLRKMGLRRSCIITIFSWCCHS